MSRQEAGCLAKRMAAEYPDGFDIIIDDGGHMSDAQQTTLQMYFSLVKRGGCYVIEDLHTSYLARHHGNAQRNTMDVLKARLDDLMLHGESEAAGRDESVTILRRTLNILERELEGVFFFRGLAILRKAP